MKNKLIKPIIGLYVVLLITSIVCSFAMTSVFQADSNDLFKLSYNNFSNGKHDMSYRLLAKGEPFHIAYTAHFAKDKLKENKGQYYSLLIYGLAAQGYDVVLNGIHIGSAGDPETGRSNVWNSLYVFDIDKHLLKEDNTLVFETYTEYETGNSTYPILIANASKAQEIENYYMFMVGGINLICMGFILFASFIVLMLYYCSEWKKPVYLYFGLGLFFFCAVCLDFATIEHMSLPYLVYKKISIFCIYLAVFLFGMGLFDYFKEKFCRTLGSITLLGIALIVLFTPDMVTFKQCYNFYSIVALFNFVYWFIVTSRHFKQSEAAKVFFFSCCFLILFGTYNFITLLFGQYFALNTPMFYLLLIAVVPFLFVVLDNQEKNQLVETEKSKTTAAYIASMTDRMTGLCNHYCIVTMLNGIKPPFYLILIDVDNFKSVNDSRGHLAGDTVIKFMAKKMMKIFGERDVLCRYGGDEFIIVHFGDDLNEVLHLLDAYRESIKKIPYGIQETLDVCISSGIYGVTGEEDVSTMIDRADIAMYHSKKQGKNRVSVYSADM